jgi:DNA-directed RNA polymerase specialized sigma subunit
MRDARRAIDTLSGRLDRHPTDQEVAKELGIEPEAYRASLGEGITLVSLSAVPRRETASRPSWTAWRT